MKENRQQWRIKCFTLLKGTNNFEVLLNLQFIIITKSNSRPILMFNRQMCSLPLWFGKLCLTYQSKTRISLHKINISIHRIPNPLGAKVINNILILYKKKIISVQHKHAYVFCVNVVAFPKKRTAKMRSLSVITKFNTVVSSSLPAALLRRQLPDFNRIFFSF